MFLAVGTPDDGQLCGCGEARFDLAAALALGDTIARLEELGLSPTIVWDEPVPETVGG